MNILDKIVANKRREAELLKRQVGRNKFEDNRSFSRVTISLSKFLLEPGRSGIIAEYKRKSPSGGLLNVRNSVEEVTKGYAESGASAVSILTDKRFFGGSCDDIIKVRDLYNIPILRKDFIIDEIQVIESKAAGADAILLIASLLGKKEILSLASLSRSLGMEVLFEIHSLSELDKINEYINIVGVNNRNLDTLKTDVRLSVAMADKIPEEFLRISESGISDPRTVRELRDSGYNGFLIGEYFMSRPDPVIAFADFADRIKLI